MLSHPKEYKKGSVQNPLIPDLGPPSLTMPGSERQRELRRRRKRRETLSAMKTKLAGHKGQPASPSDKAEMARKLRLMTPGAEALIERWELEAK